MIQDIYKNTRPLHLGVGLLAILALLSGCSSDDSLPEDTTGAFLTTRIPHERCRDPLHHKAEPPRRRVREGLTR